MENGLPLCKEHEKRRIKIAQEKTEKLSYSEAQMRSVFQAMHDGILVQNNEGIFTDCNASAERILGLSATEIIGQKSIIKLLFGLFFEIFVRILCGIVVFLLRFSKVTRKFSTNCGFFFKISIFLRCCSSMENL